MRHWIIKSYRTIKVRSRFRELPVRSKEVPIRRCPTISGLSSHPYGKLQKLSCKFAGHAAITPYSRSRPRKEPKTDQRVFWTFVERSALFNQPTCPFYGSLGFGRGITFDMHERVYQRDLKPDLIPTQRRSAG